MKYYERPISVYVVAGFFNSGKTTLIKRLLETERSILSPVLLIQTENGDEKLTEVYLKEHDVIREIIMDPKEFDYEEIRKTVEDNLCRTVLIELNGFWPDSFVYRNMPEGWMIKDKFCCADAGNILNYAANLEGQTRDKMAYASYVFFNRIEENADRGACRDLVRKYSRRARIFFETDPGRYIEDKVITDTPYQFGAEMIDINENVFAYWMFDMWRRPDRYEGQKFRVKGRFLKKDHKALPWRFGGEVTVARIQDAQFWEIPCIIRDEETTDKITESGWYLAEGTIQSLEDGESLAFAVTAVEQTFEPYHPVAILQ